VVSVEKACEDFEKCWSKDRRDDPVDLAAGPMDIHDRSME